MITLKEIVASRKGRTEEEFWEDWAGYLDEAPFSWLREPGALAAPWLQREIMELDLRRLHYGLPRTYKSDDPIRFYETRYLRSCWDVIEDMARIAGATLVKKSDGTFRAYARKSGLGLFRVAVDQLLYEVRTSRVTIPRGGATTAAKVAASRALRDPDEHLREELRQSYRTREVRAARVDLIRIWSTIVEHYPRLRAPGPGEVRLLKRYIPEFKSLGELELRTGGLNAVQDLHLHGHLQTVQGR